MLTENELRLKLQEVKSRIANNKLDQALEELNYILSVYDFAEDQQTKLLILLSKWKKFRSEKLKGILDNESLHFDQIVNSILDFVTHLEVSSANVKKKSSDSYLEIIQNKEKKKAKKYENIKSFLAGVVIVFFAYVYLVENYLTNWTRLVLSVGAAIVMMLALISFVFVLIDSLAPRRKFKDLKKIFESKNYFEFIDLTERPLGNWGGAHIIEILYYRGLSYMSIGRYEESLFEFRTALEVVDKHNLTIRPPFLSQFYYYMGWCQWKLGNIEKAKLQTAYSLELYYHFETVLQLKDLYIEFGKLEEAYEVIKYGMEKEKSRQIWNELNLIREEILLKIDNDKIL